tara:strand:+ start:11109 stop:13223 length:2115 start_codon:yes stop_codon:yes gene_type:complete
LFIKKPVQYLIALSCFFISCSSLENHAHKKRKISNDLIYETSPYLLQHAYNPVKWHAWNRKSLAEAKRLNKPIIVSIGYSACHWCHVMEHQSFEDSLIAEYMNKYFYSIKVDREERPDVDELYMRSVNLLTGGGGWPLNVFALPDGRAFHGGTYFAKENWLKVLKAIQKEFDQNNEKLVQFAGQLAEGVAAQNHFSFNKEQTLNQQIPKNSIEKWVNRLDYQNGGTLSAPKFPMPSNLQFLTRYAYQSKKDELLKQVDLSLNSMAFGGIYDHLGGGFARYSTDEIWKVPHFEKMLYDNAQLISVYSDAYKRTKNPLYQKVAEQCIAFIQKELKQDNGPYYAALDADSEGEEGKFYVWEKKEIKDILNPEEMQLAEDYYNLNHFGYWEENKFILLRREMDTVLAQKHNMSLSEFQESVESINQKLFNVRQKRIKPALDDKSLTSWNALMMIGLCDAYAAFNKEKYLYDAIEMHQFLKDNCLMQGDTPQLWHAYKNGKSSIEGLCEDYALYIKALIRLFELTSSSDYLQLAKQLQISADKLFLDDGHTYFHMSKKKASDLHHIPKQITDNVIPSDNSIMAENLYTLGLYFGLDAYIVRSRNMLIPIQEAMENYGGAYANWLLLYLDNVEPSFELVITGEDAKNAAKELHSEYLPQIRITFSDKPQDNIPLFAGRWQKETKYYLCRNQSCEKPVSHFEELTPIIFSK